MSCIGFIGFCNKIYFKDKFVCVCVFLKGSLTTFFVQNSLGLKD